MEYGGGICQVSSTLFMLAKSASMQVTERHSHQIEVDYASNDDDATVFYGQLDFKFKNTLNYAIQINTCLKDDKCAATIFKINYQ